eukprot:TRINITY_DN9423_c0_g1_i2.p1 TRINITY_DN9423_c0_g1~~TRINITY_DN9423_c0_g1_i2.p1  ORF type:complete len:201 (+),score=47.94 TRINITY_DN9423_c0_g1_i2:43-645(+)
MSFQSRMDQIRVWFSNPRSRALLIGSAWSSVLALVMLGWFCQSDRCIYGFGIACLSLTISLFGLAPLLLKKRSTEQNRGVYQKIPQESSNQEQSTFVSRLSRMKNFVQRGSSQNSSPSLQKDLERGLSSRNFDLHANIADGDTRPGLSDSDDVLQLMKERGIDFDAARLLRQQMKMMEYGIDPATGIPLDPKLVTFSKLT